MWTNLQVMKSGAIDSTWLEKKSHVDKYESII